MELPLLNLTSDYTGKSVFCFYIYAFSKRFYSKRLTVHLGYTFFCQDMCSLGIEPTTFALLTQCSTTEPQELICSPALLRGILSGFDL